MNLKKITKCVLRIATFVYSNIMALWKNYIEKKSPLTKNSKLPKVTKISNQNGVAIFCLHQFFFNWLNIPHFRTFIISVNKIKSNLNIYLITGKHEKVESCMVFLSVHIVLLFFQYFSYPVGKCLISKAIIKSQRRLAALL